MPAATPSFLRRHPALLVEWLRIVNSLSRWRTEGSKVGLLSVLAALVALIFSLSELAVGAIQTLAGYRVLLTVVAAIFAASSVSGRRRRLEESKSQSWLIATPIPPRSLLISHTIRVLLPLVAIAAIVAMFPAFVALTNDGIADAAEKVAGAAAGGLIIGGVLGWWLARRTRSAGLVVPSRYVPQPRSRSSSARMQPDATALAGWPIAQVLAWSRPENSRYVLITALLAVQGGASALAGLSVVAMYFGASYLAALVPAVTSVAKSAATWLRATPMTLLGFMWSVSRRALLHQLIGVALAVGLMAMVGSPIGTALQMAALWLGLFISISGVALFENYRGGSPWVKIALSVAAFAALATMLQLRAGAKT